MIVEALAPGDQQRAVEIARLGGQTLDVNAELARGYARLSVARLEPGSPALAVLLLWAVADERHVIDVATHPDFRRRGAARALLADAIARAQSDRARLVLLEVRRSNRPAIALYRSLGFAAVNLRRGYYSDTSEDAIEMMLQIDTANGAILETRDEITIEET
ncbi:MAG: GNAT family N-acetyltransferase [Polyangiaceae bacterium]